ncbi:MAG: hypothetical protein M1819_001628 [Sarea resinae]|nr:MAG: hypothetical protein M1819_001628 [Sarea resinae]
MDAVEAGFPNPPSDQPQWLALVQAVINFEAPLWDPATCGGGFRWQVFSFNTGYNLKNTISNGGFFQLASRLARYTQNQTYADLADKAWDWMSGTLLLQTSNNATQVYDNTDSNNNCTSVDHTFWTYNVGTLIMGSAYMYNYTNGSAVWAARLNQLLNGAETFFPQDYGGSIMSEITCEKTVNCNNDQSSFKAYLSRWLAVTTVIAPFTAEQITPKLQASAKGAAAQCVGGSNGRMCGRQWYTSTWDGSSGVGQQMAALSILGANIMPPAAAPKTPKTGGNSTGNPNAGSGSGASANTGKQDNSPVTTGDKAGAAILTIVVVSGLIGASGFMISGD